MMSYKLLGTGAVLVASLAVLLTPTGQHKLSAIVERCFEDIVYLKKLLLPPLPNDGPQISLLLVGAAGNGRSALGNYILDRPAFESRFSARMVTRENKVIRTEIGPRKLLIVDTPGLLGNQDMVETKDVVESLKSIFTQSPTGYSAFLVVLNQAHRITKEQIDAIKILEIVFGDDFFKHAIFVFTHKDLFENSFDVGHNVKLEFNQFIDNQPDGMADFIRRAANRVMFVNNLETRPDIKRDFQIELIHMVDDMNGGRRYTKGHFDNAENIFREEIEGKLRIKEMERQNREKVIWDEALTKCKGPSHDSEYKVNLNIKFPGSDFIMMAIDYIFDGFQKLFTKTKHQRYLA